MFFVDCSGSAVSTEFDPLRSQNSHKAQLEAPIYSQITEKQNLYDSLVCHNQTLVNSNAIVNIEGSRGLSSSSSRVHISVNDCNMKDDDDDVCLDEFSGNSRDQFVFANGFDLTKSHLPQLLFEVPYFKESKSLIPDDNTSSQSDPSLPLESEPQNKRKRMKYSPREKEEILAIIDGKLKNGSNLESIVREINKRQGFEKINSSMVHKWRMPPKVIKRPGRKQVIEFESEVIRETLKTLCSSEDAASSIELSHGSLTESDDYLASFTSNSRPEGRDDASLPYDSISEFQCDESLSHNDLSGIDHMDSPSSCQCTIIAPMENGQSKKILVSYAIIRSTAERIRQK